MKHIQTLDVLLKEARKIIWLEKLAPPTGYMEPAEELRPGNNLPWSIWITLNRLRTREGRCNLNMVQWGFRQQNKAL